MKQRNSANLEHQSAEDLELKAPKKKKQPGKKAADIAGLTVNVLITI